MVYNTGYMNDRKLTQADFEHGLARERFTHLQNVADLSEQGKGRVDEAMKATVAHIEKTHNLQYGMQGHHVESALSYLNNHYEGRHNLRPNERVLIEKSLKGHFGIAEPEKKTT